MGRLRECTLTCGLILFLFALTFLIVYLVTFILPDILKLEDIQIRDNTSFKVIKLSNTEVSAFQENEDYQATTPSTTSENVKEISTADIAESHNSTAPGQDAGNLVDDSIASVVVDLQAGQAYPISRKLYTGDDLQVYVNSTGGLNDVKIFIDDEPAGDSIGEGLFILTDLDERDHKITVDGGGNSVEIDLAVWRTRYGLSLDVRNLLSEEERREVINDGKANLRFYDIPNCPNCIVMRPKVASIVEEYRECVAYELISLWKPGGREDLKKYFPDQVKMVTPIIMVDGVNGRFSYMGIVPPETLIRNILKVAPACSI